MSDITDKGIIKKHLKCKICLNEFKDPRILDCMHVFCESCINNYISKTDIIQETSGKRFKCPLCSNKSKPVNKVKTIGNWVTSFPICDTINNLLARTDSSQRSRDRQKDHVCDHCKEEGTFAKAVSFCTVCVEYCCKDCYESHRKFKITRSHQVLNGAEMPRDGSPFKHIINLQFCNLHPDVKNEFKCSDHDGMFCCLCATSVHKTCNSIMRLDEISHDQNVYIQEFQSNRLSDTLTDMLTDKLMHFEKIETNMSKIQKQFAELVEELCSISEYLDRKILEKLKEQNKYENRLISNYIGESTSFMDKINKTLELAELVSKYNLTKHAIVLEKSMKPDIVNIEEFLRTEETQQESTAKVLDDKIKVLQETFINKLLKKIECVLQCRSNGRSVPADIRTLLHGKQTADKTDEENVTSPLQIHENPAVVCGETSSFHPSRGKKKRLVDCNVRKVAEHDISVPSISEELAFHSASLILGDGNMVFIDRNNSLVKYVSSDFKVKFHERLQSELKDIAYVNKKQ